MPAGPPIVETKDLTKKYGKFLALDRLTMSVEPGQILGFVGPNGAGKTTTIKILVGLARPSERLGPRRRGGLRRRGGQAQAPGRLHARHVRLLRQHARPRVPRLLRGRVRHPARERARRIGDVLDLAGAGAFTDLYVEASATAWGSAWPSPGP